MPTALRLRFSQSATGVVQKLKILLSENCNACYDLSMIDLSNRAYASESGAHRARGGAYHTDQSFFVRGKDPH